MLNSKNKITTLTLIALTLIAIATFSYFFSTKVESDKWEKFASKHGCVRIGDSNNYRCNGEVFQKP